LVLGGCARPHLPPLLLLLLSATHISHHWFRELYVCSRNTHGACGADASADACISWVSCRRPWPATATSAAAIAGGCGATAACQAAHVMLAQTPAPCSRVQPHCPKGMMLCCVLCQRDCAPRCNSLPHWCHPPSRAAGLHPPRELDVTGHRFKGCCCYCYGQGCIAGAALNAAVPLLLLRCIVLGTTSS